MCFLLSRRPDCWYVLLQPLNYYWFPLVCFSLVLVLTLIELKWSFKYFLFIEGLTEFFHSFFSLIEYLYDHYFKFFIARTASLFHLVLFLRSCSFFGSTILCVPILLDFVCFYELGETATPPKAGVVAFCRVSHMQNVCAWWFLLAGQSCSWICQ